MNRFITFGACELARGVRKGYSGWTGLGGLALGIGLIRRFTRSGPELIYSKKLRPGQGMRVSVTEPGEDPPA